MATTKGTIVKDTLRRFPSEDTNPIVRYILAHYGEVFDQDSEKIRALIRYYRGQCGEKNRACLKTPIPKVALPKSLSKKRTPYKLSPGSYLVMSDIHVPYHSQKAVEIAVNYGLKRLVSGIFLNGDVQDCAAVGFWPQAFRNFPREVELTADFLDWLKSAGLPIIWKPGNHEERLTAYYMRNAPELIGLPTSDLSSILGLSERGIEYLQEKQLVQAGHLSILHGHELRGGSFSVNPARWLFLKAKGNALCGHWHRQSSHDETNIKGENVACWSTGCLCDLNPDYNPICNGWTWGFALVHVEKDGTFEVENRRILANGTVA